MEKPPSLRDFQEQHELSYEEAFEEWSQALLEYKNSLSEDVRAPLKPFKPEDV